MGCSSSKAYSLNKDAIPRRTPGQHDKRQILKFGKEPSKIDKQGRFMRQMVDRGVIGRCDVLQEIHEYINSCGTFSPLVVVGEEGIGKTAVMAAAALTAREQARRGEIDSGDFFECLEWQVFYHFVQALPDGVNFEHMMHRLLRQIGYCNDLDLAVRRDEAARMCRCALSAPSTSPIAIFIDGLHLFEQCREVSELLWLPEELVPQVKVVISLSPGSRPHQCLHGRDSSTFQEINLLPLDINSAQSVILNTCNKLNTQLSLEELNGLLGQKVMVSNPLWLRLGLELARRREDHTDRVSTLPSHLHQLICEMLDYFEEEYGSAEVAAVLSMIQVSHKGMLEEEICALLPRIPACLQDQDQQGVTLLTEEAETRVGDYSRLLDALRLLIHPFNHSEMLQFVNTAVSTVVCKKYLISIESSRHQDLHSQPRVQQWHRILAAYFELCDNPKRRAQEYPYHLCKLGRFEELARALTDWEIFDCLFDKNQSSQLLLYWKQIEDRGKFVDAYKSTLAKLREHSIDSYLEKAEKCAILCKQAGHLAFGFEILEQLLNIQSEAEFLARVYSLRGDTYMEKIKQTNTTGEVPVTLLEEGIYNYEEAISIRQTLRGKEQKLLLAKDLSCYLSLLKNSEDQFTKACHQVDAALHLFNEMEEHGYYVEALLAKAVIHKGRPSELQLYLNAEKKCLELFGENHHVMNKLYMITSIYYEDEHHFEQAYHYLKRWHRSCLALYGPEHTLTRRAAGTLQEQTYLLIEQRLQRLAATSSDKVNGHNR